MAKVTVEEIPPVPVETVKVFHLELSEEEARTLHVILSNVGIGPKNSPSKHASCMFTELGNALGGSYSFIQHPENNLVSGTIRFEEYE